jgi:general secretion pathway protein C
LPALRCIDEGVKSARGLFITMNSTSLLSGIRGLNSEMIASRLSQKLPLVATWVLAILLGVQAALIVRSLIVPASATVGAPAAAPAPMRRTVDVQSIINAHLFGVSDPTASEPAGEVTDAPQTSLTLVLAGTIAADDPKRGFGIIGESAANAKVYSVGDTVPGGVRLHSVYKDRVLLDRSGQVEALLLPRQSLPGTGVSPAATLGSPRATTTPLADRVRKMIAQDPGAVAEIMRPQPVFMNGQQRGYRVYPGRNRQQFAQLGLQPGDLVMAINGTPLDDPARGMEIFRSIGSASQVRVTIERAGRSQELVLNMAQLANQAQSMGNEGMVPMEPTPPDDQPEE